MCLLALTHMGVGAHMHGHTHTPPLSPPFYFPLSLSLSVTGMTIVPSVHHIINMSPTVLILLDI